MLRESNLQLSTYKADVQLCLSPLPSALQLEVNRLSIWKPNLICLRQKKKKKRTETRTVRKHYPITKITTIAF